MQFNAYIIKYIFDSGLLIGRRKIVKFCGICRDKIFAEKMADFAGISWANFAGERSVFQSRDIFRVCCFPVVSELLNLWTCVADSRCLSIDDFLVWSNTTCMQSRTKDHRLSHVEFLLDNSANDLLQLFSWQCWRLSA